LSRSIEIAADNKSAVFSASYHSVQQKAEIMELPCGLRDESSYYLKEFKNIKKGAKSKLYNSL
jgi:hypothetical protein